MENKLTIIVDGQNATLKKHGKIVKGTKGYLKCGILFSEEWDGINKVLVCSNTFDFSSETATPIVNNSCMIPDSVTDRNRIFIKIVGKMNRLQIVTNTCVLEQEG